MFLIWIKWPFLGCFEVWAAQEWGVTPTERFGSGNELAGGCGRLRSGLCVGVAPEIKIFSSATQAIGGVPRARMALLGVF